MKVQINFNKVSYGNEMSDKSKLNQKCLHFYVYLIFIHLNFNLIKLCHFMNYFKINSNSKMIKLLLIYIIIMITNRVN